MLNFKFGIFFIPLLAVLAVDGQLHVENFDVLRSMKRLAYDTELLGKTMSCVADLADDPDIYSQALNVTDKAVKYIEDNGRQTLNPMRNVDLVNAVVIETLNGMRVIDGRCADAKSYCAKTQTPKASNGLAELGKTIERSGATMGCLLSKNGPRYLPQIIMLFGKYINEEANHEAASNSVDVLLPHEMAAADELQKLSSACANVVKSC